MGISCTARGDDLPIDVVISVDPERMIVLLLSDLPFIVSEEGRFDMAVAVNALNYKITVGNFDYDMESGRTLFRMTQCFADSVIGEGALLYMLCSSIGTRSVSPPMPHRERWRIIGKIPRLLCVSAKKDNASRAWRSRETCRC